ncbi:MAG: protein nirF, partial [Rhodospirillales bacterium]|nr:protein nirF [Rhodospirillales bacterium]
MMALALLLSPAAAAQTTLRGTGDLGLVIERAAGKVQIVETTHRSILAEVPGLGDLSHASAVFSRDQRFAYVFGRDGGLSKVDLLTGQLVKRVMQAGNAIGGAISQDGRLVAVSNYEPGGVRVFDAGTLEQVADIPAIGADGKASKTVGLVDAPDQRFVWSLYDAGEIWVGDFSDPKAPRIIRHAGIGRLPYDGMITPDGRAYAAGLFGEDGVALLDLWDAQARPRRILDGYGKGDQPLPVYKMPHMEGWASTGDLAFIPAVGRHEVLILDQRNWTEAGRIAVHGQPVFVVARPDGRQVWVNFAHPDNDTVQIIDVPSRRVIKELKPGPAVLHMEFTPRGEQVWLSVR